MLNYQMPLYRPPSEANNLIIQATLGCRFNQCSFCSMYRDKTYQARTIEAIVQDIQTAARYQPETRRVFLADGDAFNLPTDQLITILDALAANFPRLSRVSCYATPANVLHKDDADLRRLKNKGLSLLYLGVESGSDMILKKISKGATQQSIIRALYKADDAAIKVSATVILGLGGEQHWKAHIDGTIALFNQAPVSYLSTLQLHLEPSITAEFQRRYKEPFVMPDDQAILLEQQRFIRGLSPPKKVIFRSNHASNALALAGVLPKAKEALLSQLQAALDGEQALRPRYLRSM